LNLAFSVLCPRRFTGRTESALYSVFTSNRINAGHIASDLLRGRALGTEALLLLFVTIVVSGKVCHQVS
jgi:hypothetical protein